jgi:hypothetical protein
MPTLERMALETKAPGKNEKQNRKGNQMAIHDRGRQDQIGASLSTINQLTMY